MSIYVALMIGGLTGLAMMAVPGLLRHGHAGAVPRGIPRFGHGSHAEIHAAHRAAHVTIADHAAHAPGGAARDTAQAAPAGGGRGVDIFRLIPSPRAIFSLMTLFGAGGYTFMGIGHFSV